MTVRKQARALALPARRVSSHPSLTLLVSTNVAKAELQTFVLDHFNFGTWFYNSPPKSQGSNALPWAALYVRDCCFKSKSVWKYCYLVYFDGTPQQVWFFFLLDTFPLILESLTNSNLCSLCRIAFSSRCAVTRHLETIQLTNLFDRLAYRFSVTKHPRLVTIASWSGEFSHLTTWEVTRRLIVAAAY